MPITYLKRATKTPVTGEDDTRADVERMLRELEAGGEERARDYAKRLDGYEGEILVGRERIAAASRQVSETLKDDIGFAHARVRDFARHQRDSLLEFEVELSPGLFAGQKLVPVTTAGAYVPGGRYAHVASAIMSVTTAKVAGVERIVACSPPKGPDGVHPAILHALDVCGADTVLCLGGVQGIAALAFGLFSGRPADILVGPGNRYVAEAKRILFGRVGIDLFAGPTEIAIIADDSADPEIVAVDLVGQAEHGPDSPAWLVTTSRRLAEAVMARVAPIAETLPEPNRGAALAAWRDYGEVVVVDTREEAVEICDRWAPEHLEVHAHDPEWWLAKLRNYGSLFLGEETTVTYGDKASGPNHILPTRGAARYTGGLSVGKFIKTVTYQRMTRAGSEAVGAASARISRLEGMEGHARTADRRLAKYFPEKRFDLAG
jgi:sulfopropanediol 3-dehydrogenase